eukprot:m.152867 g.152867  ORF g.152867 m.152867 type:complete len:470 (+) comp14333_c0_seq4:263-1672(+)
MQFLVKMLNSNMAARCFSLSSRSEDELRVAIGALKREPADEVIGDADTDVAPEIVKRVERFHPRAKPFLRIHSSDVICNVGELLDRCDRGKMELHFDQVFFVPHHLKHVAWSLTPPVLCSSRTVRFDQGCVCLDESLVVRDEYAAAENVLEMLRLRSGVPLVGIAVGGIRTLGPRPVKPLHWSGNVEAIRPQKLLHVNVKVLAQQDHFCAEQWKRGHDPVADCGAAPIDQPCQHRIVWGEVQPLLRRPCLAFFDQLPQPAAAILLHLNHGIFCQFRGVPNQQIKGAGDGALGIGVQLSKAHTPAKHHPSEHRGKRLDIGWCRRGVHGQRWELPIPPGPLDFPKGLLRQPGRQRAHGPRFLSLKRDEHIENLAPSRMSCWVPQPIGVPPTASVEEEFPELGVKVPPGRLKRQPEPRELGWVCFCRGHHGVALVVFGLSKHLGRPWPVLELQHHRLTQRHCHGPIALVRLW